MSNTADTNWTVPWRGTAAALTLRRTRWRGVVSVLVDGTEMAKLDPPTLNMPASECALAGSHPAVVVVQIARPGATETEVFVDGIGLSSGESLAAFRSRVPAAMTDLERLSHAPILKARVVLPVAAVGLFVWLAPTAGSLAQPRATLVWIYSTLGLTLAVSAHLRLARLLVRRWPNASQRLLFYITVWSLIATWGLEALIGYVLFPI
jgi:hypothetical protein